MSKKSKQNKQEPRNGRIAANKRARHDFELVQKFEAGLALTGSEVKTLRLGRAQITDGYISVDKNGEAWIENVSIPPYINAGTSHFMNHQERRKRKLLLHKKEIAQIQKSVEAKGMTAVPLALYFLHGKAKIEFALARGKHLHDKRETIKQRTIERETAREFKRLQ
jgi:SsrA-binding protein